MARFLDDVRSRWTDANTMVCVGLDPEPAKFPAHLREDPDGVFGFCRAIVDAHGGRVTARNRPEGGAEFVLSLPRDEAAPRVALDEAPAAGRA